MSHFVIPKLKKSLLEVSPLEENKRVSSTFIKKDFRFMNLDVKPIKRVQYPVLKMDVPVRRSNIKINDPIHLVKNKEIHADNSYQEKEIMGIPDLDKAVEERTNINENYYRYNLKNVKEKDIVENQMIKEGLGVNNSPLLDAFENDFLQFTKSYVETEKRVNGQGGNNDEEEDDTYIKGIVKSVLEENDFSGDDKDTDTDITTKKEDKEDTDDDGDDKDASIIIENIKTRKLNNYDKAVINDMGKKKLKNICVGLGIKFNSNATEPTLRKKIFKYNDDIDD